MKKIRLFVVTMNLIFGLSLINSCGQSSKQEKATAEVEQSSVNTLSNEEIEEGFVLLFDGKTFDGWRGYNRNHFPEQGWVIEDGMLRVEGSGGSEAGGAGGDIIYHRKYKDFHLKLDWKVSPGGNSGILYLAQEIEDEPIWKSAPEMQVLDNEEFLKNYPDFSALQMAGSLYDLVPADPQNTKPAGEWNSVEIIVKEGIVVHKQNDVLVVECHIDSPDWEEKVAGSKFAPYPWFGKYEPGYIGLQDHGDDVWFKNIRIKEL